MQPTNPPASQEPQAPGKEPKQTTPPPAVDESRKTPPEIQTPDQDPGTETTSGAIRLEVRPHAFVIMPFG
jgi:hypothetical protein